MATTVKGRVELVVPRSVRRQAGIKAGDQLEFKASSRTITITALEPVYRPTKAEAAAILKGEDEIARGEFVTLNDLLHDLDHRRRKGGAKAAQKNSRKDLDNITAAIRAMAADRTAFLAGLEEVGFRERTRGTDVCQLMA